MIATSVVEQAVRGVPVADLLTLTAVLYVGRPLKTCIRRLRVLATTSYGLTVPLATPIVARAYEVAATRGPVVPSTALAPRLARRIALARLAST